VRARGGTRHIRPVSRRAFGRGLVGALAAIAASPAISFGQVAGDDGCGLRSTEGPPRIADPALASRLPEPFAFQPWQGDRGEILDHVAATVSQQAADAGAVSCFRHKAPSIAERVDFLSPFEFLVATAYESDPAARDSALETYGRDPQQAVQAINPIYPSPRAEMILTNLAYYDLSADRIRVNLGRLAERNAARVLVHEFWHAMPAARSWNGSDGTSFRASGFWVQKLAPNGRTWMPVDNLQGLPFPPFLLAEGMATLMETRFAGPTPSPRPDIEAARRFLDHADQVVGEQEVMRLYLESQPDEFSSVAQAHRGQLPELSADARR
jgi:hypothetical protein